MRAPADLLQMASDFLLYAPSAVETYASIGSGRRKCPSLLLLLLSQNSFYPFFFCSSILFFFLQLCFRNSFRYQVGYFPCLSPHLLFNNEIRLALFRIMHISPLCLTLLSSSLSLSFLTPAPPPPSNSVEKLTGTRQVQLEVYTRNAGTPHVETHNN